MSIYTTAARGGPMFLGSRGNPRSTGLAWPSASNTGVPSGTVLTSYTGPSTITTDGTIIDSKTITSCIVIQADDVVIRKCRIVSGGCFFNILNEFDQGQRLLVQDCEIDGLNNLSGDCSANVCHATLRRCNLHGTVDGMKVGDGVTVEDCYIHDLYVDLVADTHNDGIQSLGTDDLTIRHNTIICPAGGTSAIILSTGSASDMRNILIDNNLLAGGGYTVYGGYQSGVDDVNKVSNIVITNNRISTQIYPNGGSTGPFTSIDSPVVCTNNSWYDGPNAGSRIN